MALKLDISKAYDHLEWGYLRAMLEKMGFDWKMDQFSYVLCGYCFLHDFPWGYEQIGLITGCKISGGAPVISHMLFADDSYIYCKATEEEAHNVKELLYTYEMASGQKINFNKSSVFYSHNTNIYHRDTICHMLDIYEADENDTYLGLPYSVGRNKNTILGFLKDKIRKRIQGWEGRILSRPGKEVLLKAVAQSISSYAMSLFLLPFETCKELERLMEKFWSKTDSILKEGVSWMSWDRLSRYKNVGGLGFRILRDFSWLFLESNLSWEITQASYGGVFFRLRDCYKQVSLEPLYVGSLFKTDGRAWDEELLEISLTFEIRS
ncbi:hypothetical protein CsatA_028731 [Cannabis sativa]